ncbi:MAG: ribonuclease H-like domain-containing protein [Ardenticatenaceae bacterium]|nr:ribonuclease H-like domain-containing protein [Ardenticatenaceae bacterium]
MMDENWQDKLRRLGVVKGTRNLKPAPPVKSDQFSVVSDQSPTHHSSLTPDHSLDVLLPGLELVEANDSACYVLDKVYPLAYRHGQDRLADLLAYGVGDKPALSGDRKSLAEVAVYLQDSRLNNLNFHDFLFLDTETTGLAGAGTIAFMVGVAFFDGEALVVRQYFLRDFGDEPAMLHLLDELLAEKAGLVTFNGRTFDLPLLDTRYLMNRMPGRVQSVPHIDLLQPSRRLWRARFGSVALGNLEQNLLGLQRTHEDVPGFLIPGLYHDYLRSGDGRDLLRVFYHNEIDMLSMVTLATRVTRLLTQPDPGDHPIDRYSLGKWQAALGLMEQSEQNLRFAAQGDLPLDLYHQALFELSWLLKRNGRHPEAVSLWQQIAATTFDDVTAHVELAKYYEWHELDLVAAIRWTEQALTLSQSWSQGQAALARDELEHRMNRLQRKWGGENA